jgi:hypothetical protein
VGLLPLLLLVHAAKSRAHAAQERRWARLEAERGFVLSDGASDTCLGRLLYTRAKSQTPCVQHSLGAV